MAGQPGQPMPDNPGDPEHTDTEGVTPEQAENAAERAAEADGAHNRAGGDAAAGDPAAGTPADPDAQAAVDAALAEAEAAVSDADTGGGGADDLSAQLAERTSDLQRVTAEYANYRRRTDRDRKQTTELARAQVITELLPVLDDLDLVDQHGDLTGPLKAVSDKLQAAFTRLNVARIGAAGEQFNPEIHEAVQDLSSGDDKRLGTVLRPGYMLGERLLRTAMVIIADPQDSDSDSATGSDDADGSGSADSSDGAN